MFTVLRSPNIQVHDVPGMAKYCHCAQCETERTMIVSPSTEQHVMGYFDVDLARARARQNPQPRR